MFQVTRTIRKNYLRNCLNCAGESVSEDLKNVHWIANVQFRGRVVVGRVMMRTTIGLGTPGASIVVPGTMPGQRPGKCSPSRYVSFPDHDRTSPRTTFFSTIVPGEVSRVIRKMFFRGRVSAVK